MLDHIGIDVSDLERSKTFYQAALEPLGYDIRKETDKGIGFGVVGGYRRSLDPAGEFWIAPGPPTPAVHYAFSAPSRAHVDAFYKAALAAGGKDNGAPGPRPHYHENYYGAFVLDPDGYNIEAVCHD